MVGPLKPRGSSGTPASDCGHAVELLRDVASSLEPGGKKEAAKPSGQGKMEREPWRKLPVGGENLVPPIS